MLPEQFQMIWHFFAPFVILVYCTWPFVRLIKTYGLARHYVEFATESEGTHSVAYIHKGTPCVRQQQADEN